MFCPRCGSSQADELKFCKACGANLFAVRKVVDTRETSEKFDWSKTWLSDMVMSGHEAMKLQAEIERQKGTPAIRRYQEIKAGIITSSVGLGVAAFLAVFMDGIVDSGRVSESAAHILSHLWIAGIIPLFVGLALIINGYFISRKIVELDAKSGPDRPDQDLNPQQIRAGETTEFVPASLSVTEGTTKHLGIPREN